MGYAGEVVDCGGPEGAVDEEGVVVAYKSCYQIAKKSLVSLTWIQLVRS